MTDESTEDANTSEEQETTGDITSLSDVFDDSKEEVTEEPKKKTEETESEDEKGEDEEKSESEEKEESPSSEPKLVSEAALIGERRRRQEAEKNFRELKSKYEPDDDEPDPVEDPEAYKTYVKDKINREIRQERLEKSRESALGSHADYEEKERIFMVLVAQDQSLAQKMHSSNDPGEFAYTTASDYLDGLRKSEREKLEKEMQEKSVETEKPKKDGLSATEVPDLTKATDKGKNTTSKVNSNDELEEVFEGSQL